MSEKEKGKDQGIMIDIMPTNDRKVITLMFRSDEPINPQLLARAITQYGKQFAERVNVIKNSPSIITP